MISLGGQAPRVLRAHMGHVCGGPNEIELTIRVLTGWFAGPCQSKNLSVDFIGLQNEGPISGGSRQVTH